MATKRAPFYEQLDEILSPHIDPQDRDEVYEKILELVDKAIIGKDPIHMALVALDHDTQRRVLWEGTNRAAEIT